MSIKDAPKPEGRPPIEAEPFLIPGEYPARLGVEGFDPRDGITDTQSPRARRRGAIRTEEGSLNRTSLALCALLVALVALVAPRALEARKLAGTTVTKPAEGSAEWVVAATLEAGMANSLDAWYETHCHPDYCLGTPRNRQNFVKYRWKRLRKWVETYYTDVDKRSFEIVRTDPTEFDEKTSNLKLFLKSNKRDMPVPIQLQRDKKGAWKVFNMSL